MPTLQELLMDDVLGSTQTKTASVAAPASDDASLEKIAMELGLWGDSAPAAAAPASEKVAGATTSEVLAAAAAAQNAGEPSEKVAGFGGLYSSMFPDDTLGGEVKTAEEEKVAAEEALGARTWDHFAARFDARIEKLAYAALAGSAHKRDVEAPNHLPNNKPQRDAGGGAINTTPSVEDSVKDLHPEGGVGEYEQEHADHKTAAVRKQMLLAMLEG